MTGFTPSNFSRPVTSLEKMEQELKTLVTEKETCDTVILNCSTEIQDLKNIIEEKRKERTELEGKILKLEKDVAAKKGDKAQTMIKQLEELGYNVFKKDVISEVNFVFPNMDRIFGLTGTLLFNGSPISDKFHNSNFDQLLNKNLTLTKIPLRDVEGTGVMADWIREHRFDGIAGVDTRMLEQRVEMSFLTPQKVVSFKKEAIMELTKLIRQYDNQTLSPYYTLEFSMREYKPYRSNA